MLQTERQLIAELVTQRSLDDLFSFLKETFPDEYELLEQLNINSGQVSYQNLVLTECSFYLFRDHRGEIVGASGIGTEGTRSWMLHTAVSEEHRRTGVGSRIVEFITSIAEERGHHKLSAVVSGPLEFFERNGFKKTADTEGFPILTKQIFPFDTHSASFPLPGTKFHDLESLRVSSVIPSIHLPVAWFKTGLDVKDACLRIGCKLDMAIDAMVTTLNAMPDDLLVRDFLPCRLIRLSEDEFGIRFNNNVFFYNHGSELYLGSEAPVTYDEPTSSSHLERALSID